MQVLQEVRDEHAIWRDISGLKTKIARILRAVKKSAIGKSMAALADDVKDSFLTYYGKHGIVRSIRSDEVGKLRGLFNNVLDKDDEGVLWIQPDSAEAVAAQSEGCNGQDSFVFPEIQYFEEGFLSGDGEILVAVDQAQQRFIGSVAICPAPVELQDADRMTDEEGDASDCEYPLWEVRRFCVAVTAAWEPAAMQSFLLSCAMGVANLKGAKRLVARAWERTFNYTLPTDSFYKAQGFMVSDLEAVMTDKMPDIAEIDIDLSEASIEEILAFRRKVEEEQKNATKAVAESVLYEVDLDDLVDEILRLPLPEKMISGMSRSAQDTKNATDDEEEDSLVIDEEILAAFDE